MNLHGLKPCTLKVFLFTPAETNLGYVRFDWCYNGPDAGRPLDGRTVPTFTANWISWPTSRTMLLAMVHMSLPGAGLERPSIKATQIEDVVSNGYSGPDPLPPRVRPAQSL